MLAEGPHALAARWRDGRGGSHPRAQTADCAGPCAVAGGYTQEGGSWGAVLIRLTRIRDDSGWRSQERRWPKLQAGEAEVSEDGGRGEQTGVGGAQQRNTPGPRNQHGEWGGAGARGQGGLFPVFSGKL